MENNGLQYFIGFSILVLAAFFDALGYNIQRRDHCRNAISSKPRHECFRKYWHLGFYIYVSSLIIGYLAAMSLVPPHWIAPVRTSSLVFNIIFARVLVGTVVTRRDIIGTGIILLGIFAIVLFSTIHNSDQKGVEMNLEDIEIVFSRLHFKIYFTALNSIIFLGFFLYLYLVKILKNPTKKPKAPNFIINMKPEILARNAAIIISILGGIAVSESVLLAKSGLSLVFSTFRGDWAFFNTIPIIIILVILSTSFFQLYCLNAGLKLADSLVVGPIFLSIYNFFALINSLIFLDQYKHYEPEIIVLLTFGLYLLILGVVILASQVKSNPSELPKLPKFRFLSIRNRPSA